MLMFWNIYLGFNIKETPEMLRLTNPNWNALVEIIQFRWQKHSESLIFCGWHKSTGADKP